MKQLGLRLRRIKAKQSSKVGISKKENCPNNNEAIPSSRKPEMERRS